MQSLTVRSTFWILFALNIAMLALAYQFRMNLDRIVAASTYGVPVGVALVVACGGVFLFTGPGRLQDRCLSWMTLLFVLPISLLKMEF